MSLNVTDKLKAEGVESNHHFFVQLIKLYERPPPTLDWPHI